MRNDDPLAVAGAAAIHTGDLAALQRLLAENPGLAKVQIEGRRGGYRTPLHAAADWPGYFPNGPAVVRLLLANGADLNGGAEGFGHQETPLHWAASSDDVDVAEALIDGGADIEAHGADLNWVPDYAKGTPLEIAGSIDTGRTALVTWLQENGAQSASNKMPTPVRGLVDQDGVPLVTVSRVHRHLSAMFDKQTDSE